VVAYHDASWGEPVDVVLDGAGGNILGPALAAVRTGGRLVFFNAWRRGMAWHLNGPWPRSVLRGQ
jgi:NADPH:quinone reductase-like Zn-dependent oxidoreductase